MKYLISRLLMAYEGRPAVIIGGGPSATIELPVLQTLADPVIISANGHAFKLGVPAHYIWCKDHTRCIPPKLRRNRPQEYMETELRVHGVPIIGPNYWADYRAVNWPISNANSGMQALAAAALMGCRPIIGVGFDCFQGDTYFHDPKNDNVSSGRPMSYWSGRYRHLHRCLQGATIRGISGVLAQTFGRYRPLEEYTGDINLPTLLQRYVDQPTNLVRIRREVQDSYAKSATIPADYIMACTKEEADRFCKLALGERA
jgi:hypothetical protein